MTEPAKPYTEAQLAGIERVAALADQDTTIPRLLANLAAVRAERDEARAENFAIRVRTTAAHEAVYRAMRAADAEALASLRDDGYLHRAIHAIFCGPDGTSAYSVAEALRLQIEGLGERATRAEAERDEARALLDQQAALHAEAERIDRNAIDRCTALAERVAALTAEVADVRGDLADAEAEIVRWRVGNADLEADLADALAHVGTLLAIVERVADRLTAEDGADVAALVARVARERQTEREALAKAEAERDALRAAARALLARLAEDVAIDQCDRCEALATRQLTTMQCVHDLCDAHAAEFWGAYASDDAVIDLPHASPLRALLALLPPEAT